MENVILFSTDHRGYAASRMLYYLRKAGLGVWIFCPITSIMRESDYINGGRAFNIPVHISRIAQSIHELVQESKAKAIFPCDDFAFNILNSIRDRLREDTFGQSLQRLIAAWIGSHPGLRLRSISLHDVCGLGIRTPRQITIDPNTTGTAALGALGNPLIVKSDYSCAGMGVALAASPDEALLFAQNTYERDLSKHPEARVVAQEFISGTSACVSFSAYSGKIIDAFSYVIVRRSQEPFGASSVVTLKHCPDLVSTAQRIVATYDFSGFGGIDFILPDDGTEPVFIEFNPRQTRTTHLGSLVGSDLCAAMASALIGTDHTARHGHGEVRTIALFPHEWQRDPHSPYLLQCHHDVPWYEPRVTAAVLTARRTQP